MSRGTQKLLKYALYGMSTFWYGTVFQLLLKADFLTESIVMMCILDVILGINSIWGIHVIFEGPYNKI